MDRPIDFLFTGFEERRVELDGAELAVLTGGSGPAVLLLHGYPQTRAAWHRIAPVLARHPAVVLPDLTAYGLRRILGSPEGSGSTGWLSLRLPPPMQSPR